jgi:pimeloyl-ACP methyl ester carboxylesterase
MSNFLLIHGAWHGGWCWNRVASRLRSRGHAVFAPTMTGLGERSHLLSPEIGLETHIADFVNVVRWERLDRLVLCGHSLGGFVMTGVADRIAERVDALVYLDAFVPKDGQSPFDLSPEWRTKEILDAARDRGDGWRVPPEHSERWVEHDDTRAWVDSLVTPHPLRSMSERVRLSGAVDRIADRSYAIAAKHKPSAFWQFYDKLKDDPGWHTHSVPALHDAMIDAPDAVCEILDDAARRANSTEARGIT